MKLVTPSSATAACKALLASGQFMIADLFQFTLVDGTVLRYAGADQDIVFNGATWPCGGQTGPFFQLKSGNGNRGLCSWKIGTAVDTLQFDVVPGQGLVEGFAFMSACRLGLFDGAEMILYRAVMPTYGNTADGAINIFTGRVVEIDCGRSLVTFNINSHLELLSLQMPRNLFQSGCLNTLYDSACTLLSSNFTVSGACSSACTTIAINSSSSALSASSGYYQLGTIAFTSGQNNGFRRNVKVYATGTPNVITPLVPLPYAPAQGDTFTIKPGCDKSTATCTTKFSNQVNFRGQPFIPAPETGV